MEHKSLSVVMLSCSYNEWQFRRLNRHIKHMPKKTARETLCIAVFFTFFFSLKDMFSSACFICTTATSNENAKVFRRVIGYMENHLTI